jgi:two-component system sensor kinase FixL
MTVGKEAQALMDAATEAVIVIDHTGRIDAANRAAERLFGYSGSELLGENVSLLMPQSYRDSHDGYLARYAATGITRIMGVGREVEGQKKDGSVFPAFISIGEVAGEDRPRYVGFMRDITPQRDAIMALLSERDRANGYLTLYDALLMTLDARRRVLGINPKGCELLDVAEHEFVGRDWLDMIAVEDRTRAVQFLESAPALGVGGKSELLLETQAADRTRQFHWSCVGLAGEGGGTLGWLCSGVDVTDQFEREEESRIAQDRMMRVSRLVTMGEMAAGVAHELNQPLAAIVNYARACERLLEMPDGEHDDVREAVREIGAEAMRAGEIIRRLRRLVQGDISARAPADINEVIEDLRILVAADARSHDTVVNFDLAGPLPPVRIDSLQIQHVILSFFRNSVEALMEVEPGERQITIGTALPAGADQVEVSVADSGPGVSPRAAESLFHPFSTTKASGTGMSLAVSRTIVQAHGGRIGYEPLAPRGVRFYFQIPIFGGQAP